MDLGIRRAPMRLPVFVLLTCAVAMTAGRIDDLLVRRNPLTGRIEVAQNLMRSGDALPIDQNIEPFLVVDTSVEEIATWQQVAVQSQSAIAAFQRTAVAIDQLRQLSRMDNTSRVLVEELFAGINSTSSGIQFNCSFVLPPLWNSTFYLNMTNITQTRAFAMSDLVQVSIPAILDFVDCVLSWFIFPGLEAAISCAEESAYGTPTGYSGELVNEMIVAHAQLLTDTNQTLVDQRNAQFDSQLIANFPDYFASSHTIVQSAQRVSKALSELAVSAEHRLSEISKELIDKDPSDVIKAPPEFCFAGVMGHIQLGMLGYMGKGRDWITTHLPVQAIQDSIRNASQSASVLAAGITSFWGGAAQSDLQSFVSATRGSLSGAYRTPTYYQSTVGIAPVATAATPPLTFGMVVNSAAQPLTFTASGGMNVTTVGSGPLTFNATSGNFTCTSAVTQATAQVTLRGVVSSVVQPEAYTITLAIGTSAPACQFYPRVGTWMCLAIVACPSAGAVHAVTIKATAAPSATGGMSVGFAQFVAQSQLLVA